MTGIQSPERSLIACVLMGGHKSEIFTSVSENDFIDIDCRNLFMSLKTHWQQYGDVDVGCVPEQYRVLALESCDYLASLSSWRSYIGAAKSQAMKYNAQGLALSIATGNMELDEIREAANKLVLSTQGNEPVRRMGMAQALQAFWEQQAHEPNYLKTQIRALDRTAYIESGDYIVIGARPSTGKTALALKLARNIAKQGLKTVFYSYETTIEKMMGRTMAAHCNVDMSHIKQREVSNSGEVAELASQLAQYPFELVESSGKDIGWIKADVVRNKADVIFIDYIGQVSGKGDGRYEKITNISLDVRNMCQATGAIAFVLCQINRQGRSAPTMEDLKESGQIEQDADIIMILHNPTELKDRSIDTRLELIVAKNKEGPTGSIEMSFDASKQEFWEVDRSNG